jgi:hypothetical protein
VTVEKGRIIMGTVVGIVGTVPSSHANDDVEINEVVVDSNDDVEINEVVVDSNVEDNEVVDSDVEDNEVVIQDERSNDEKNEVVVVGTIPYPTNLSGESSDKKGKTIVYKRRRFKNQGEWIEQSQPQQTPPVPNLPSDPSPSNSLTPTGNLSPNLDHIELPLAQQREPRVNAGKPPPRLGFENDITNFIGYSRVSTTYRTFIASLQTMSILKDWRCAKQDPRWKDAMKEKMSALQKNKAWELVQLLRGKKTIRCKWVFTVKQTPEGKVERYKARLVVKDYSQTYGIDYDETFTPVAKMIMIRTLISSEVNFGWSLHQLDMKNAFLHGDLEEEIYPEIPPVFANNQTLGKVCKLKKSLYGLKQLPRAWFDRFRRVVCDMGYSQCNGDHTAFYRHNGSCITILVVYVDDIVITGDDVEEIKSLKERLGRTFEVNDLGPLRYFLGIEIARSSKGIVLSQRKYVLDLLAEMVVIHVDHLSIKFIKLVLIREIQ